jgi:hypothetical protein
MIEHSGMRLSSRIRAGEDEVMRQRGEVFIFFAIRNLLISNSFLTTILIEYANLSNCVGSQ